MNKVNARLTTCEHCSEERARAVSQYGNGDEFAVCYECGKVVAKRTFDALDFIVSLMHEGITKETEIVECLIDKLSDEYYWLDSIEVETLAGLMVRGLYDKANFEYMAEAQDQAEEAREFREAMVGRY